MCGNLTRNRASLLLEVARMYWDEGLGQTEIARRTGYSRPTISRMLAEARRVGVVTVTVAHPIERLMALEKRLVDAFGLKTARVSEATPGNGSDVGPDVARTAADLLLESCGPHSVIAVSNGRAVAAVVHHTPERSWPSSTAVAMLGSVGESFNTEDGPDVCRNLSLRLGGRFRSLTVPLVFDSLALARAVREEDQVATTLELAARSDIALTGVGTVGTSVSPLLRRWMTPEVVRECRKRNVVAHVCGHHLDASGRHVHTALCDRTLCLDPERLREIPLVVGVAAGPDKIVAIRAALRGGYLSALVTDEATARAVLKDA
ncbi:sugar-binding transcriptional regulator [Actinomyces gerencseriae]|jgi:protein containing sugar-binding domain|uniref:sugar-binding transcriptional regulator n=1 Tax=Actinomyces gerencseriae TaxID=52769 RepID=UPI0023F3E38F|nr:sugar-binding domain-containing protein [Actinomyces gerencseriae]